MKALALLTLLAGCSVMGHEPVADWPTLKIIEHRVPQETMVARCAPYVPYGTPMACAEFHFSRAECHVWLSPESPTFVVNHERMHCAGYDHIGSTNMRNALASHRKP